MKRYNKLFILAAIALTGLVSCSEDETVSTPLASPVISLSEIGYDHLTFSWEAVQGATQYGYKLTSSNGKVLDGEVTEETSVSFSGLEMLTEYQLHLWAFPTIETPEWAASTEAVLSAKTPFYSVVNATGTMTSIFFSSALENVAIEETRTEEDKLGTFTIKAFYGKEGYDLTFSVNEDNTIKILNENATVDEATGFKKVPTGSTMLVIRNGVLIDESQTLFDRINRSLSFPVKSTKGVRTGTDTFKWTE